MNIYIFLIFPVKHNFLTRSFYGIRRRCWGSNFRSRSFRRFWCFSRIRIWCLSWLRCRFFSLFWNLRWLRSWNLCWFWCFCRLRSLSRFRGRCWSTGWFRCFCRNWSTCWNRRWRHRFRISNKFSRRVLPPLQAVSGILIFLKIHHISDV